jgi:hypothetical protein
MATLTGDSPLKFMLAATALRTGSAPPSVVTHKVHRGPTKMHVPSGIHVTTPS